MLKEELLPVKFPRLPTPQELEASGRAEGMFTAYETACTQALQEQEEHFQKALRRMNTCAYLRGALGLKLDKHFSWCPHEAWDEYWQAGGWPPLATLAQPVS